MRQAHKILTVATNGQGLYEITAPLRSAFRETDLKEGVCTVYCRHTSASLTIQENADPDVKLDLTEFYKRLVPEHMNWLRHTMEGPDDMPAHIKSALTDMSLSIPFLQGDLVLGTWQGVYLFEHRHARHERQIIVNFMGSD